MRPLSGLLTRLSESLIPDTPVMKQVLTPTEGEQLCHDMLKGGFYGWTLFQSRVQRGIALSPSGIVLCLGQWGCTRALRILLALLSLLSHVPRSLRWAWQTSYLAEVAENRA
jgi:hypothetical protein